MTVEPGRGQVRTGGTATGLGVRRLRRRQDVAAHRRDVLTRLLDRGVSIRTLRALLPPEWSDLIGEVAASRSRV